MTLHFIIITVQYVRTRPYTAASNDLRRRFQNTKTISYLHLFRSFAYITLFVTTVEIRKTLERDRNVYSRVVERRQTPLLYLFFFFYSYVQIRSNAYGFFFFLTIYEIT